MLEYVSTAATTAATTIEDTPMETEETAAGNVVDVDASAKAIGNAANEGDEQIQLSASVELKPEKLIAGQRLDEEKAIQEHAQPEMQVNSLGITFFVICM